MRWSIAKVVVGCAAACLAIGALPDGGSAAPERVTRSSGTVGTSSSVGLVGGDTTAGPLADPGAPGVDATTLIAIPRAGVSIGAIEASARAKSPRASVTVRSGARGARFARVATEGKAGPQTAKVLVDSGLFEAVEYNQVYKPAYATPPNDPLFPGQWELKAAPGAGFVDAWPTLDGAAGPTTAPVAVIDTGCMLSHEDAGARMSAGWDFGQNRPDTSPFDPQNSGAWHGSGVASIIGAATDNGTGMAAAGWDSAVICYKAADATGVLRTLAVAQSVQHAAANGARVINLSLVGEEKDSVMKWAIEEAIAQGVVVVAAAGNNGNGSGLEPGEPFNTPMYPAGYDGVIAVAATDSSGVRASFSNSNPLTKVAIAAPGVGICGWCIYGAQPPGGPRLDQYCSWNGTSFASPLVAAAAALVLRVRPGLSPSAVAEILTSTAQPIGATIPNPETGWGLIDVEAALAAALSAPTPGWFSPPHGGVFSIEPNTPVTLGLGIGGLPLPTASLAPGSTLPASIALENVPGVGWALTGSFPTPGLRTMTIIASRGKRVIGTQTLTIHVGGFGAANVKVTYLTPTLEVGQPGSIQMTVTPTGTTTNPSGWYDVMDLTLGEVVGEGLWYVGTATAAFRGLTAGIHDLGVVFHGAGATGPWTSTPITLPRLVVTEPPPSPTPSTPSPTPSTPRPTVPTSSASTSSSAKPSTAAPPTTTPPPAKKAASSIRVKKSGSKLVITVTAKGIAPVKGKVTVKVGKAKAKTLTLKKGKATVKLPKGKSKVKVTFPGTSTVAKRTLTRTV